MAAHAVRKAAHALAEEGELLNVHSDLKDLAHAVDARIKANERVSRAEGEGERGRGRGGKRALNDAG